MEMTLKIEKGLHKNLKLLATVEGVSIRKELERLIKEEVKRKGLQVVFKSSE